MYQNDPILYNKTSHSAILGEFGIVYKGYYIKTSADSELCAVKTLRGSTKIIIILPSSSPTFVLMQALSLSTRLFLPMITLSTSTVAELIT